MLLYPLAVGKHFSWENLTIAESVGQCGTVWDNMGQFVTMGCNVWGSVGQWGHRGRLMVHEASGRTDVAMPLLPPMFLQLSCNVP